MAAHIKCNNRLPSRVSFHHSFLPLQRTSVLEKEKHRPEKHTHYIAWLSKTTRTPQKQMITSENQKGNLSFDAFIDAFLPFDDSIHLLRNMKTGWRHYLLEVSTILLDRRLMTLAHVNSMTTVQKKRHVRVETHLILPRVVFQQRDQSANCITVLHPSADAHMHYGTRHTAGKTAVAAPDDRLNTSTSCTSDDEGVTYQGIGIHTLQFFQLCLTNFNGSHVFHDHHIIPPTTHHQRKQSAALFILMEALTHGHQSYYNSLVD